MWSIRETNYLIVGQILDTTIAWGRGVMDTWVGGHIGHLGDWSRALAIWRLPANLRACSLWLCCACSAWARAAAGPTTTACWCGGAVWTTGNTPIMLSTAFWLLSKPLPFHSSGKDIYISLRCMFKGFTMESIITNSRWVSYGDSTDRRTSCSRMTSLLPLVSFYSEILVIDTSHTAVVFPCSHT